MLHRVAVVLLLMGAAVWGASMSGLGVTPDGLTATRAVSGPEVRALGVEWGPVMASPAQQVAKASRRSALVVAATGFGVLAVATISALLLFAASRTARRPQLRVHRAVGAPLRTLRRAVSFEAGTAVSAAMAGAAALAAVTAGLASAWWRHGSGSPADASAVITPVAAVALLAPAVMLIVVALFRATVPNNPLPAPRPSRTVSDPFSGFAVTQVSVAVAALTAVSLIPATGPDSGLTEGSDLLVTVQSPAALDSQALRETLVALPGVDEAHLASPGSWLGLGVRDFLLSECGRCSTGGLPSPLKGEVAAHIWVGPDTLERLELDVVAGRSFEARDFLPADLNAADLGPPILAPRGADPFPAGVGTRVALVSQAYAYTNFERGDAVGRRVRVGQDLDTWYTVIGVVASGPAPKALGAAGQPDTWVVLPARPGSMASWTVRVTGTVAPQLVEAGLGDAFPGIDARVRSYPEVLQSHAFPAVWVRGWLVLLGAVAALVAFTGVFTALRAQVQQRRVELAIRRAVGASRRSIHATVLGQAVRIAAIGIPVGLWVATFLLQPLRSTTGASWPSPALMLGMVGAIGITCLAGGWGPARAAANPPPAEALRQAELS